MSDQSVLPRQRQYTREPYPLQLARSLNKPSLLIENPELRHRIGVSERKTVEERYSVKINAPKYLEIFRKVYEERYGKPYA